MFPRFKPKKLAPYLVLVIYLGFCVFTLLNPHSSWLLEITKGCLLLWLWLQWLEKLEPDEFQLVIWTFLRIALYGSMLTDADARARLLIVMLPIELLNLLVFTPHFEDRKYRWGMGFTSVLLLVVFGIILQFRA